MKKIITLLSCLLLSSPLLAQKTEHKERVALENYRIRIQAIDDFVISAQKIEQSAKDFKAEVANYKNPKILKKDQVQLEALAQKATTIESEVASATYFVETKSAKVQIKELEKMLEEREKFLSTQKLLKELESNPDYTMRMNRFIELTKASKYNQAKAMYFTLNAVEKGIADNYEKANTYLIQQKYMQDPLEEEIINKKKKIEDTLQYPEKSIVKINANEAELQKQKLAFQMIQDELKLDQYDIKFDTWAMGLFNCEKSNPQYFVPVNYPNMLMLKNEGGLQSVLKLDPKNPTGYQIAYACKKKGRFGGCLDNEKKELCRLDSACLESLGRMEGAYNRNAFFTDLQSKFPHELLKKQQSDFREPTKFNLIQALAEENKLGYFKQEEIYSMMDPIIEVSKTIVAKTPEEYIKKFKVEIDKNQKKMIASITKLAGSKPDVTKIENSKRAVNYIFVSITTEMEKILNDDTLQARAYEDCGTPAPGREVFCEENALWQDRVRNFDELHQTKNLTPDECPRGVFRSYPRTSMEEGASCEGNVFLELENTIKDIEKTLK